MFFKRNSRIILSFFLLLFLLLLLFFYQTYAKSNWHNYVKNRRNFVSNRNMYISIAKLVKAFILEYGDIMHMYSIEEVILRVMKCETVCSEMAHIFTNAKTQLRTRCGIYSKMYTFRMISILMILSLLMQQVGVRSRNRINEYNILV